MRAVIDSWVGFRSSTTTAWWATWPARSSWGARAGAERGGQAGRVVRPGAARTRRANPGRRRPARRPARWRDLRARAHLDAGLPGRREPGRPGRLAAHRRPRLPGAGRAVRHG